MLASFLSELLALSLVLLSAGWAWETARLGNRAVPTRRRAGKPVGHART